MHNQAIQEMVDKDKRTSVNIGKDTRDELNKIGMRGETFDQIIQRCIKAYKQMHKGG